MTTFTQGLAWIDAISYRIVRLHMDLLRPLPEGRLETEAMKLTSVRFTSRSRSWRCLRPRKLKS